jgi:hypothetical protein
MYSAKTIPVITPTINNEIKNSILLLQRPIKPKKNYGSYKSMYPINNPDKPHTNQV